MIGRVALLIGFAFVYLSVRTVMSHYIEKYEGPLDPTESFLLTWVLPVPVTGLLLLFSVAVLAFVGGAL